MGGVGGDWGGGEGPQNKTGQLGLGVRQFGLSEQFGLYGSGGLYGAAGLSSPWNGGVHVVETLGMSRCCLGVRGARSEVVCRIWNEGAHGFWFGSTRSHDLVGFRNDGVTRVGCVQGGGNGGVEVGSRCGGIYSGCVGVHSGSAEVL
jgi:hypothetical protein